MKKLLVVMLALMMLMSISACKGTGNNEQANDQNGNNQTVNDAGNNGENDGNDVEEPELPEEDADSDDSQQAGDDTDGAADKDDAAGTEDAGDKDDAGEDQETVRLSHTDVTLKAAGNSFTLKVEGMEGTYAATYTVKDSAIATVNEKGVVTAVAPGTTTVSVQVEEEGGSHSFSCIVRCNWKEDSNSGSDSGESSGSAASVDLSAFYSDMTATYEFPKLQAFTGDVLESYYAGMGNVATKQCLVMGSQMTMNNGEFCLVEVSDSKDVDTVKSIFQSRIDYMANGGAWYPGPTELWTNSSRVVSNGNFVMMVVHESCDDIVEAFNGLF